MNQKLKDIIPNTNDNEIQIMKIKDENHFNGDKDIEKYIKSLGKFDDNKFNICNQCKKEKKIDIFVKNVTRIFVINVQKYVEQNYII